MKKSDFVQLKPGDRLVLRKTIGLGPRCVDDQGFRWESSVAGDSAFTPGEEVEFVEFYSPFVAPDATHGVCFVNQKLTGGCPVKRVLPRKLIKRKVQSASDKELEIPAE